MDRPDMHADAIDVHIAEDHASAVLTIVNVRGGAFTVTLPVRALRELRDRISRVLPA